MAGSRTCVQTLTWLAQERQAFRDRFPKLNGAQPALSCSWEELERQLESLADTHWKKGMVAPLISATRKQAWCKPNEMVLREVLVLAGLLQDQSFSPDTSVAGRGGEESPMR